MRYGRPIVPGGKLVQLDGKPGVYFEPSPEEEAFQRWQDGKFLNLERQRAKKWRAMLSNVNLETIFRDFQKFFPCGKPKTLADVKKFVDLHLDVPGSRKDAGQAIGQSGDGGIDGIIKEDKLGLDVIYLQAKRWENVVGSKEI